VASTLGTLRKKKIQLEIEEQQSMGSEGLLDEYWDLGECNLWDPKDNLGIMETYWLLAMGIVSQ
jgi:hypothetical protein